MSVIELRGHTVSKGKCEGLVIVSKTPISFMGGVDAQTGIVVEKGHELEGMCISDAILVFPYGKGSTVGSYILYELLHEKKAPKGIVNLRADPIIAIGAIISEIPMVDRLPGEILNKVETGDNMILDATEGTLRVIKRNKSC